MIPVVSPPIEGGSELLNVIVICDFLRFFYFFVLSCVRYLFAPFLTAHKFWLYDINNRVPGAIDLLGSDDKSEEEDAIKERLVVATTKVVEVDALYVNMTKEEAVRVLDATYQISMDPNTLSHS